MSRPPIYLDYAATSAVRPPEVAEAVCAYLADTGATPGRGCHRRSLEAGRTVLRCRAAVARLLGAPDDPGRVVFQLNATYALNLALRGLLRPGDRVVRTTLDHNAVRRPLGLLRGTVRETVVRAGADGSVDPAAIEAAIDQNPPARLLVLTLASNVLGTVLPVGQLAHAARERRTLVLMDAAQAVGHIPVDVDALGADVLVFTGHKGMLGPQGTGGMWIRPGVEIEPFLAGGTGGRSTPLEMPARLPDRLEAGSQNGPGLAGLLAGLEWIERAGGVDRIREREGAMKARLRSGLEDVPEVRLVSPPGEDGVGIVTFLIEGCRPANAARLLEQGYGIEVRAGLHCSPETHEVVGTLDDGAVRMSVGWATTGAEVDAAVGAVQAIARSRSAVPAEGGVR